MNKPDGGPAFPEPVAISPMGDTYTAYSNMTMRDWFAGQCLIAMGTWAPPFDWTQGEYGSDDFHVKANEVRAAFAYAQADAMIAERAK